jgi:hypothetical protein
MRLGAFILAGTLVAGGVGLASGASGASGSGDHRDASTPRHHIAYGSEVSSGSLLSVERIAQIAAAQPTGPLLTSEPRVTVEVALGTFAQAWTLLEQTVNVKTPDEEAYWQSPAYLVLLRGTLRLAPVTERGTSRALPPGSTHVPLPAGPPPSATVRELILDAHTGSVEAELSDEGAPVLSRLGTVSRFIDVGGTIHRFPPNDGQLEGSINEQRSAANGWQVLVKRHQIPVATGKTVGYGGFYFLLPAARYTVTVRKPSGHACPVRTIVVKARQEVRLQLRC